ncbi:YdbL family protein [Aliidiomarina indica]|uniref:YdbL family protein n=1 Tax=Aliidiomarina indica TaxID=2749147 RepID=UPI001890839B|nr:YdbL family protein [Aliidiomarina indica]
MTLFPTAVRIGLMSLCASALLSSHAIAQPSAAFTPAHVSVTSSAFVASSITMQDAANLIREYKDRGYIGETRTGYVGVVRAQEHAEEVARLINEVRREEYIRLAKENNVPVAEIEALAGQRAIQRTQTGHYIEVDGEWVRKP